MNTLDKNISDLLNTEFIDVPNARSTQIVAASEQENEIVDDAEYARKNLYGLIEASNDSIETISQIAKESSHPRAFEVLGQLIKTQSENLDKLLKLQKDKKELLKNEEATAKSEAGINVEQAVFVGSTSELLRALKNEKILEQK